MNLSRPPSADSSAGELYTRYREQFCGAIDHILQGEDHAGLADCLRANAARFAAHKAHYVERTLREIRTDESMTEAQRQERAESAVGLFEHWGEAEKGYATQSAQMAEKWQAFEKDGDEYLLQYRTANDEKVRAEHAALQGITLPVSDPFWDKYYPPLGWNCRCTVVQVRRGKYDESESESACKAGAYATEKTPSFRFNPGKEKKVFPEGVSYLKHAGTTAAERARTERECEAIERDRLQDMAADNALLETTVECEIEGKKTTIHFAKWGIRETAQSMFGSKAYWIKNEILQHPELLKKAQYISSADVDMSHNTGKTLQRKKHFARFHYLRIEFANKQSVVVNVAERKDGEFYLYTVTSKCPVY